MPDVDGKALVRRYLEDVFSGGNLHAVDQYLAGEKFKEGVIELVTRWRTAFSCHRLAGFGWTVRPRLRGRAARGRPACDVGD